MAQKGVKGATIREICALAQVNVGAVNYHFGSKEGLVAAVLSRRLRPLNEERRRALEGLLEGFRSRGERPRPREVVRAFLRPVFRLLKEQEGGAPFVALLGRAFADPDPTVKMLFLQEMAPIFDLLFETMAAALPHLPPPRLFWRLHFLIGAMGHLLAAKVGLHGEKGPLLYPSALSPEEAATVDVEEELMGFVTAGLDGG